MSTYTIKDREYYIRNKESIKLKTLEWHKTAAYKEYVKNYYKEYNRRPYVREKRFLAKQLKRQERNALAKARWHSFNPDYRKNHRLVTRYGITLEDFNRMMENQKGLCAICFKPEMSKKAQKGLSVDHNHKTGKVRGLVCHRCNLVLGHIEKDVNILVKTQLYLNNRN